LLILDEPTNHLDITSKEILEDALNSYEGTVLYVSHDRYFINRTADRILELCDKTLTGYLGNYDYYTEKKQALTANAGSGDVSGADKAETVSESKLDWKAKKEQQAQLRKKENAIRKCEEAIEKLEKELAEIEETMALPEIATDAAKLQELSSRHQELNTSLLGWYEQWEELETQEAPGTDMG